MPKFKKLFGDNPEVVRVNYEAVKFDANGFSEEVSDEVAEVLYGLPGHYLPAVAITEDQAKELEQMEADQGEDAPVEQEQAPVEQEQAPVEQEQAKPTPAKPTPAKPAAKPAPAKPAAPTAK